MKTGKMKTGRIPKREQTEDDPTGSNLTETTLGPEPSYGLTESQLAVSRGPSHASQEKMTISVADGP